MEVLGLKNFVQDDVNKLIAKFVGVIHPVVALIRKAIHFKVNCPVCRLPAYVKASLNFLRNEKINAQVKSIKPFGHYGI